MKEQPNQTNKSGMSIIDIMLTLVLCGIFGGDQVSRKVALTEFRPLLCGTLAFCLASIVLFVYAQIKSIKLQPHSIGIWKLHSISAILFVFFNATALSGIKITLASRASIFIATYPFLVAIFNSFGLRGERLNVGKFLGLVLAFSGVLTVFSERLKNQNQAIWIGDCLILLSAALLALMVLHIRTVSSYVSTIQVTFWQLSLSLPFFLLLTFIFEYPLTIPGFSFSWLGIIYQGIAVNVVAFVLRANLFHRYSPTKVSAFFFITPIMGVIFSHFLLGDLLNQSVLLGGMIVSMGIFLVYRC